RMEREQILTALQEGEITLQGQFVRGSNYTFLAETQSGEITLKAVYKPARGEQPLWDFPAGTLGKREAAAYLVSQALGWGMVPPTVFRRKGPLGRGSLQLFIPHNPNRHYFNFTPQEKQRLRPVAVLDVLINNADRKGGHILLDEQDQLLLIDHGICFHVEDKLRTVVWDFAGQVIPAELLADVQRIINEIETQGTLVVALKPLLRLSEIRAILRRGKDLLEKGCFPLPSGERRVIPWPPV
ncbi:MAG TPA: SCO1664 family protein, partial [Anaerolineaceae bacterium]|nr:SCO1664 family protein [Anaerolineaceae bacterium]